ncbi:MAG: hypothetical protein ABI053_01655 [Lacisediminihabitans sp.]
MSVLQDNAAQRSAYWPVPIVRAVPAAALGLVITFVADHSARFGLLSFGIFAVVGGLIYAVHCWLRLAGSSVRPFLVAQGAVSVAIGIFALLLHDGGIAMFFLLVTAFALITGFLELYCGLRTRRRFVASGDWLVAGVLTILTAIALLLVPPGLHQSIRTAEGATGVLDASVVAVGILGAYAAILAVYLLIAGFSAKWGTQSVRAGSTPAGASRSDIQTKGGTAA